MDKTDIALAQLLLRNSRITYRELADKLDLSVNAVHRRIQALTESGVIRTFTAKISLLTLKAFQVQIFGKSETRPINEVHKKLEKNDSIYWVAIAGGDYVYVGAFLENISKLEPYVAFVEKEAQISDPTVGIVQLDSGFSLPPTHVDATLYPLDYQIIYALHKNSRKLVSKVAEELGVSTKTVQRRLSRMIRGELIELSIEWYPDVSNDIITFFHLHLKASADKSKSGSLLIKKYSPNALFFWSFSNIPNFLICVVWTNTMKQLRDIRESFQNEGIFESINPNILYTGYIFDTWRDKIVLEKGSPRTQ